MKMRLKTLRYKSGANDFLFVSNKIENIEEAVHYHFLKGSQENGNITLGKLYGYPRCCSKHLSNSKERGSVNEDDKLRLKSIRNSKSGIYPFYLNNFNGSFIIHHVCSYNCQESAKIGKRNASLAQKCVSKKICEDFIGKNQLCLMLLDEKLFHLYRIEFTFSNKGIKIPFPARLPNKIFSNFEKGDHYTIRFNDKRAKVLVFK